MSALVAVAWKEARELIPSRRARWAAAVGLLVLGAVPVALGGDAFQPGVLLVDFVSVPAMLSLLWATDSFAGERERGTLDTLLASGAPDRSLVAGKLLVSVVGAWGAGLAAHGVSRVAGLAAARPAPAGSPVEGLVLAGLLLALAGGAAGTLASLRAHTTREALTRLFLPWIALDIALRWVAAKTAWAAWSPRWWLVALAAVDLGLIVALGLAFRRRRLALHAVVRRIPSTSRDPAPDRPRTSARRPSFLRDVETTVWKEVIAFRRMQMVSPWLLAASTVFLLVVLLPQSIGDSPDAWTLPLFFPLFTFALAPMASIETVAGERVRSTWETLRSARLDARALFLGKALALWLFAVLLCGTMSLLTLAGLALHQGRPDPAAFDWETWSALFALGCAATAVSAFLAVGWLCRTDSYKVAQVLGTVLCLIPLLLLGLLDELSEGGAVDVVGPEIAWRLVVPVGGVALGVALWGWRRFRVV